jgi:uncharacterized membrane protein YeaQ/YmgE (transglycosylase-associated protein family)
VLFYLLSVMIGGLVIGALGRLALPGPQPMTWFATMLVGIGGSLLAGIVGRVLFGRNYTAGWILSILCATLLVWLFSRRTRRVA